MKRRLGARAFLIYITPLLGGCATVWPDWRNGSPQHEHNNFCGHAYLQGTLPDPTPGDFAGPDAPRGPLWENQIRFHDPHAGQELVFERPVPWTVPGNGNPADRTLPGRAAPHDTNLYPVHGPDEDKRGVPHWPLDQGTPREGHSEE